MNDQNGNKVILPGLPAQMGNPEIVSLLEGALSLARQGKIVGVSVILAHGPDALSLSSAGQFPSTLIAGCHQMARQLSDAMFAKRSSVLMPRR